MFSFQSSPKFIQLCKKKEEEMSDQSEVSVGHVSARKSNSSSDFEKPFTRSSAKKGKRKQFKSCDNISDDNFHEKKTAEEHHKNVHMTDKNDRKFICKICNKDFSLEKNMQRHKKEAG